MTVPEQQVAWVLNYLDEASCAEHRCKPDQRGMEGAWDRLVKRYGDYPDLWLIVVADAIRYGYLVEANVSRAGVPE